MIEVDENLNIFYSVGDTFNLEIEPEDNETFTTGSTLQVIIAQSEEIDTSIIDKTINLSDGKFTVTLTSSEIEKLKMGEYVYKMKYISGGKTITQISGNFTVKWGA